MSRLVEFLIPLSFVLFVCLSQAIAGTTMISYTETFSNNKTFTDDDQSPLNSASIGVDCLEGGTIAGYPGLGGYGVTSDFGIGDFTELKTSAGACVFAMSDDDPYSWTSVQMTATAVSTLTAFGVVENPGGFTSGYVELPWIVDGESGSELSDVENATVELMSTTTLTQTTPLGGNEFTVSATPEDEGEIETDFRTTVLVDWGQDPTTPDVPVFFELKTQLELAATNDGSGRFIAEAFADFSNTAVLDVDNIRVFGNNPDGSTVTLISGATFNLTPVPEPSSSSLLALIGVLFGYARWSRSRSEVACV